MLRLDATTRKLQVLLAGAVTTNELPIMSCYSDKTASGYGGGTSLSLTTGATPVDTVAAPGASTVRDIDFFNIRNADTTTATVTIRFNDNGTPTDFLKAVLSVGDVLAYTSANGWRTLDSTGSVKNSGMDGVGFTLIGAWSGATTYLVNDVVTLSGSSYACILNHTNQTPPNATYWVLIASAGTNGTNGTNGQGVPTGGTALQVLRKVSSTNYDTEWATVSGETSASKVLVYERFY